MTAACFLKRRTAFIRQFYDTSSTTYVERITMIEKGVDPWLPAHNEDGEPPYLEEWIEADESIQVLAQSCISMLAATLQLYFKSWVEMSGIEPDESLKPIFRKNWLLGYKEYFRSQMRIDFDSGKINLHLLQELVLARNRIAHQESIYDQNAIYSKSDLKKLPHPFFMEENERALLPADNEEIGRWLQPPRIRISRDRLYAVLAEVDQFGEWLESVEASTRTGE